YKSNRPFGEVTAYIRKQFSEYLILEDGKFVSSDQGKEQFECQRELLRDIASFGKDRSSTPEGEVVTEVKQLVCKVLRYDSEKDYGFISSKELHHDVYFKMSNLESIKVDAIHDSDVIYCTLTQGARGVMVK